MLRNKIWNEVVEAEELSVGIEHTCHPDEEGINYEEFRLLVDDKKPMLFRVGDGTQFKKMTMTGKSSSVRTMSCSPSGRLMASTRTW